MDYDEILDARSLTCPMPILQTKKKLAAMQGGQVLCVWATDPDSVNDFDVYTKQTGHRLVSHTKKEDGVYEFIIQKRT